MLKFLTRLSPLHAALAQAEAANPLPLPVRQRQPTDVDKQPWLEWGEAKRRECATVYTTAGNNYTAVRLKYGVNAPPASSVRTWVSRVLCGERLAPCPWGKRSTLTPEEEGEVLQYIQTIRDEGAPVDCHVLQVWGLLDCVCVVPSCLFRFSLVPWPLWLL
jgi:hypothetical protein